MLSWFGDSAIADSQAGHVKEVPVTSGVTTTSSGHAVYLYGPASSLTSDEELPEGTPLAIAYSAPDVLADPSIDVLLGASNDGGGCRTIRTEADVDLGVDLIGGSSGGSGFELFDSQSGQDLTLSPQTFTSSTEAFINDNSNSLGVPCPDNDTEITSIETIDICAVGSTEEEKAADSSKLTVRRAARPKALSPNRQGPQQCQICSKVFGNASALAKHKLTHSDERKYVCGMCGKAFKRQDHLNGHMLTHRNKKPYECKADGCGKSYCDARSLRRHTENHHASSSPGAVPSSTTPSPAGTSGTGADSPPSCIQYAPRPTSPKLKSTKQTAVTTGSVQLQQNAATKQSQPVSQLQQLLATDPSQSSLSSNNKTSPSMSKTVPTSSKPVECNLCHRKFKNVPALNGHMRLHGGYFKKESDSKKCEKKEVSGPPLQTASISVRALIEEKIIQKRITTSTAQSSQHLPPTLSIMETPVRRFGGKNTTEPLAVKISSFVVPSLPSGGIGTLNSEKVVIKTEEGIKVEHIKVDGGLKVKTVKVDSSGKIEGSMQTEVPVKSDSSQASVSSIVTTPQLTTRAIHDHPIILKKVSKPITKRTTSDPGSNHQEINDGAQAIQNAIQGETYSIGVYSEDGGYFSPTIQDDMFQHVQSVQESMLLQGVDPAQLVDSIQAAGLQDIGAIENYHSPTESLPSPETFPNHQDLQSVLDSPLPVSLADFASLPSPSFTYPTPPASHEGQSPSFPNLVSQGNASPLSAAFYTSPMSSSAAVEAALNEVLPEHGYPSPPPHSPLSSTPVPSPLSLPASSTSPLSHPSLTSQMMPNSDDPLLSSAPKDFGARKRVDIHGVKVVHQTTNTVAGMEVPSSGQGGVTGIVLDRNGELKLIQTSCFQSILSGTVFVNTKAKLEPTILSTGENGPRIVKTLAIPSKTLLTKPKSGNVESSKEDMEDDVFLSPTAPSSPVKNSRKRPRLDCATPPSRPYESRLRVARSRHSSERHLLFTPPPILPPTRHGQGLYWQAVTTWPSSTTSLKDCGLDDGGQEIGSAPECDTSPHINLGTQYQVQVPPWSRPHERGRDTSTREHLLWDPTTSKNISDTEVDMYLEFACCAAVPGGGRNKEYALHLLHLCHGKIHDAMLRLMQPTPFLPVGHPLLSFDYPDSERWSPSEMDLFQQALIKYDKDFLAISQEIGTKSTKQCVQFYYIWKKVCPEEYKRLRLVRRRFREAEKESESLKAELPTNDADLVSTSSESRLFVCEYADCSASFNSRAALNGHIRIHVGGGAGGRASTPDHKRHNSHNSAGLESMEEFPCKICGKIFNKVKSRSAHMKSHRASDGEARKGAKVETVNKDSSTDSNITARSVSTVSSSSIALLRHPCDR
ncbi:uncharacterized protein isoform X3 [Rhodnius prolixus]|uniref:uncharacterized protein isoform X3 n=1 Tax=Rhodnius prolixus TaxID=13249 RepID=UPI003D189B8C